MKPIKRTFVLNRPPIVHRLIVTERTNYIRVRYTYKGSYPFDRNETYEEAKRRSDPERRIVDRWLHRAYALYSFKGKRFVVDCPLNCRPLTYFEWIPNVTQSITYTLQPPPKKKRTKK
jgi:hypothetical protein